MQQLIKEKINQAVEILNEKKIDLWITFVRESSTIHDPMLDMIVGTNATWQSAFIINKSGDTTAIVGSLEVPNLETTGSFKNITGYVQSIKQPLLEYLEKNSPQKIALNYSMNSNLADGLTHGLYLILKDHLKETNISERFVSSEEIVAALKGRKSVSEIELINKAIAETERMFDEMTKFISAGKTEKDIASFIKSMAAKGGFELAWDEDHCPAVFTGPDTAGAHAAPTDRKVEKGHLVNVDFGIKFDGYCSDMQRTWYVLRDGETAVPQEVRRGFDVLKESITRAFNTLKPGIQGCIVDDAARNFIVENGYEEYPHGLGHQVGRNVHDGGAGLFPRWERYKNAPYLFVEENQIFTIEPRLPVAGYGTMTMEEMVIVEKNGSRYLTHPQEDVILLK